MRAIDTLHLGRSRWICCWQVGEVLIDPGPALALEHVLAQLDGFEPRALLLTHIHFDHAGGAGTLAARFPQAEVYVHERGAPHMADPARLWASAAQLYGEQNMLSLWGEFVPVPPERLRILRGGETLALGAERFEVLYTPGHAKHHVTYLHGDTAFAGDVAGVRIDSGTPTLPPTPPPDIDLEAWHRSIELIRARRPARLALTHFGAYDDAGSQLDELERRLDRWARSARAQDREAWVADVKRDVRASVSADQLGSFLAAMPLEQSYAGLRRYWDRNAQHRQAQ
jgi:glyoxylase-like metal-dependent hydrolase (beta-lactamase superfamily II)